MLEGAGQQLTLQVERDEARRSVDELVASQGRLPLRVKWWRCCRRAWVGAR
jgi:hypothetical protein